MVSCKIRYQTKKVNMRVKFCNISDFWIEQHRLMGQTYQFYLAFENSNCNDYVSERFFNVLHADMIPVVMNGANMSLIAPKHSFIDVKDFQTIRG